jgi:hypothetical protein
VVVVLAFFTAASAAFVLAALLERSSLRAAALESA